MSWFIKGEAGRTLDATLRELSSLNIDSAQLVFQSLSEDSFTWSAATLDATGAGTIVPDYGQIVELWLDGVRKFRGHVTKPRVSSKRITVRAEGAWWWLTRTPLTSDQIDGGGVTAERVNYVFPTGAHNTKVSTLISRAITNGTPMRLGTVAAMYDTPNMSLAEMNCAQALAELMAWVPDAVAWFDYSDTTGDATPILNVGRRGAFSATTYTIGTDAVIDQDITPRLDLEVTYSRLDYIVRNATTGLPSWASQASGTAAAGKRQIVTVSGPEIVDFLPVENIERIPVYYATTNPALAIQNSDPGLTKLAATWPTAIVYATRISDPYTFSSRAKLLNGRESYEDAVSSGSYESVETTIPAGKTAVMLGLDGKTIAPDWLLAEAGLVRWFVNDFYIHDGNGSTSTPVFDGKRRTAISNALRPDVIAFSSVGFGVGNGSPIYAALIKEVRGDDLPIYLIDTANVPAAAHTGTFASGTTSSAVKLASGASATDGAYVGRTVFWIKDGVRYGAVISAYVGATKVATLKGGAVASSKAPAFGQAYTVAGEFVSEFTYDFLVPPAGLAAGLQAAQNWVPWEGPITLIADQVTASNLLAAKYNLAGTVAAAATMQTLARSVSHDIMAGRTTIDLGAPARADFGTLTSRIRRQPRDNIVYL
jgi:hypothetical protein